MELKINECEVCIENIFFHGDDGKWYMRIENSNWNLSSDGLDYDDYEINYCYRCGQQYENDN